MSKKRILLSGSINRLHFLVDSNRFEVIDTLTMTNDDKDTTGIIYTSDTAMYVNNPYIGLLCYNNIVFTEYHDLIQINMLNRFGINTPKTYFSKYYGSYINILEDDVRYIIKPFGAANSGGKVIVDKKTLFDMSSKIYEDDELLEKFNINDKIWDPEDRGLLNSALKNDAYYIQEVVDFEVEYRVIYIKGMGLNDIVVEKRDNYLTEDAKHYVVNTYSIDVNIRKTLKNFATKHNLLATGFDVYVNSDGSWGVFEFSPGYGLNYYYKEYVKLRNYFNNMLENEIERICNE